MLQKFSTVPALGAVLLILTAGLFVQNIDLGLSLNLPQKVADTTFDPSSSDLFAYEHKTEAIAEQIEAEPVKLIAESKPTFEPKPVIAEAKVEAITVIKPTQTTAPGDIESLIEKYAQEYGADANIMMVIAKCESGFRADAVSPSGAYIGMFQFVSSTWQSNRRAMGLDDDPALMMNAEEAIRTAAFKMGRDGYGAWPACSQKAFSTLALN